MDGAVQTKIERLISKITRLSEQHKYEHALPLAIQMRDTALDQLGADNPTYAASLDTLAALYLALDDVEAAEPLYRQACTCWGKILGEQNPEFATILSNLADLYKDLGKYTAAEPLYHQASALLRCNLGKQTADYAASLNNLAELYRVMGDYAAAEPLYRQASALFSTALGDQHPTYASSLNSLGELYRVMGNYAAAESLNHQAATIFRATLGEQAPEYATSLNNLAVLYESMGYYDTAASLYRQASSIVRAALGKRSTAYATSLNNLAALYDSRGNYAAAERLYRQAIVIFRAALGEQAPEYATSLNNLAVLYESIGNYSAAEPLLNKVIAIKAIASGEQHPSYATSLNNLAALYESVGNYAEAERLYRQAGAIFRATLGEGHPDVATSLNNLAGLYQRMGNYRAAEPLYRQAITIRRIKPGERHPDYAESLNNLALLLKELGCYEDAEALYREASEVFHTVLGKDHPSYAASLNNLGALYESLDNYEAAKPLYQQANAILHETLGEQHPNYAASLNNLAALYERMNDYAAAGPLYQQARTIVRDALGEQHPDYASSLNSLGMFYRALGNYDAARPLCREASTIWGRVLGEQHPTYATSLNNLALLEAMNNGNAEALALMLQASKSEDRTIGQVFASGSDHRRMAYLASFQCMGDGLLSLVYRVGAHHCEAVRSALDLVLRRKALGAEALAAQRDMVFGGRYSELAPQLQKLTVLRAQIARATLDGPGTEDAAVYRKRLSGWIADQERLEAELARQIPEMNLEQRLRAADRHAVAAKLPAGSALVEFVRFDVFDFTAILANGDRQWQPARYLAFILPAGAPDEVTMIDLGKAEAIEQWVADFRRAITGHAEGAAQRGATPAEYTADAVSVRSERPALREALVAATRSMLVDDDDASQDWIACGTALREALFDPLRPALAGRTRLFLAPDGDLARLPFETLPLAEGRCLIDMFKISYLGVGRDVLRFDTAATREPGAPLVAAAPDYDLGSAGIEPFRHGIPFRELDDALAEGERIANLLGVPPLLGAAVIEQAIKGQQSPRILHLSTHGFFLPAPQHDPNKDRPDLAMSRLHSDGVLSRLKAVDNPLLRSGLALAGANTWLQQHELPPDVDDGLLNAVDVSGLDLLDTELVVLSACETGLGAVQVGEGVFGLRRAFTLAGARTLVMSLWKVPDCETRELMEDFYRRLLAGTPRAAALRAAQLALKASHPHPRFWGAFICQGEPGLLAWARPA